MASNGRPGRRHAEGAVIVALAGGARLADAASQAGVSERTVARWRARPDFQCQVTAARAEMLTEAIGRLARISSAAATTLGLLLKDDQSPGVRLGAARAVLATVVDLRAHEELERRVAALEERTTA